MVRAPPPFPRAAHQAPAATSGCSSAPAVRARAASSDGATVDIPVATRDSTGTAEECSLSPIRRTDITVTATSSPTVASPSATAPTITTTSAVNAARTSCSSVGEGVSTVETPRNAE